MESGKLPSEEYIKKILGEANIKNYKAWMEGWERQMIYGIEAYHTDSEGNQRLLSIEETLEFLEKNKLDGRE